MSNVKSQTYYWPETQVYQLFIYNITCCPQHSFRANTDSWGRIYLHINLAILLVMAFSRASGEGPAEAQCAEKWAVKRQCASCHSARLWCLHRLICSLAGESQIVVAEWDICLLQSQHMPLLRWFGVMIVWSGQFCALRDSISNANYITSRD